MLGLLAVSLSKKIEIMGGESKAIIVWNKLKMGESLAVALLSPIYLKFFFPYCLLSSITMSPSVEVVMMCCLSAVVTVLTSELPTL